MIIDKSLPEDVIIKEKIVEMQQKLNNLVEKHGIGSEEALCMSQELDILVNQIMKSKLD